MRRRPERAKRKRIPQTAKRYATHADYVIHAEIYGAQVGVFRKKDRLDAWREERGMAADRKSVNACANCVTDPAGVDWFVAYIPSDCPVKIVCHEALHLAWYILDSYGVRVSINNHEALAYLQEHLVAQLLVNR